MKKTLITGISGFAGSFLAQQLKSQGNFSISGTYLSDSHLTNISDIVEKKSLFKIDLTDFTKVSQLISIHKPEIIFHLAAFSSPADSYKTPSNAIHTNIISQLNILESLRMHNLINTKVLVVSSGEIYGLVAKQDLPINEQTQIRPISPYGVSKIAQDFLGLQYFLSYKMPVLRVRPFNHLGPKLSPNFAPSAFAKKIAEIEKGKRDPVLTVGNLEAKRDFTDVRDMVKAYILVVEKGEPGEVYNIGSGVSHKISEILDILLSLSSAKIKVEVEFSLLRPTDIPELLCDNKKVTKATGWKPTISIKQSLKDTLDYWRNII